MCFDVARAARRRRDPMGYIFCCSINLRSVRGVWAKLGLCLEGPPPVGLAAGDGGGGGGSAGGAVVVVVARLRTAWGTIRSCRVLLQHVANGRMRDMVDGRAMGVQLIVD